MIAELYRYFDDQPAFGPDNQNLIDLLRSPGGDVTRIRFWPSWNTSATIGPSCWDAFSALYAAMLTSLDLIREEEVQRGISWSWSGRGAGLRRR